MTQCCKAIGLDKEEEEEEGEEEEELEEEAENTVNKKLQI